MQLSIQLKNPSREISNKACSTVDETAYWEGSFLTSIPDAREELLPGVFWGDCHRLFTPAYWRLQYELVKLSNSLQSPRLGESIIEEVVACLLGGYGIPAETGLLAFKRLKQQGLITEDVAQEKLQAALTEPLTLEKGKQVKYRFSKQKSKYIARFLAKGSLKSIPESSDDLELRDWLLNVEGVGPKTAAWVTRNWLFSEKVAIIDIHLLRAGMLAGFFPLKADVTKEYFELEFKYLNFCSALNVRPSIMDAIIWQQMKDANVLAIQILRNKLR